MTRGCFTIICAIITSTDTTACTCCCCCCCCSSVRTKGKRSNVLPLNAARWTAARWHERRLDGMQRVEYVYMGAGSATLFCGFAQNLAHLFICGLIDLWFGCCCCCSGFNPPGTLSFQIILSLLLIGCCCWDDDTVPLLLDVSVSACVDCGEINPYVFGCCPWKNCVGAVMQ